jgi:hypothetical protein
MGAVAPDIAYIFSKLLRFWEMLAIKLRYEIGVAPPCFHSSNVFIASAVSKTPP